MREADRLLRGPETEHRKLRRQLLTHPSGRIRVGEQRGTERDVSRPGSD